MMELCDSLGFLSEICLHSTLSEENCIPYTVASQDDPIWLIFCLVDNSNSSGELTSPSNVEISSKNVLPFHVETFHSNLSVVASPNEKNISSPTSLMELLHLHSSTVDNSDKFLIVYRKVEKDVNISLVEVHLVHCSSARLRCIAEFEVEDCLDKYLEVIRKIDRRIFLYSDGPNASFSLKFCISNGPDFSKIFSSNMLSLPYVLTCLAFSFPYSHWLKFWPWNHSISIPHDWFSYSQLLLSTRNSENLLKSSSVFWFYIVPFLVERLRCLERYCSLSSLLLAFDSFELVITSFSSDSQLFSMKNEQCLKFFLNGFNDLSAFSDPIVLDILRRKILPYSFVDDFNVLISSVSSDFLVRVLQNVTICQLIADYRPEFIISLLENSSLLRDTFKSLYSIAKHEGDTEITSWLRFILNIYLDISTQIESLKCNTSTVMNKITRTFLVFEPLQQTVDMELQRFERIIAASRHDLRILAKLALRKALRSRLSRLSSDFVSLSSYIFQLPIPDCEKLYISMPGIIKFA